MRAFLVAGTDERRRLLESYRASLQARLITAHAVFDELESSMMISQGARTPKCTVSAKGLSQALGQVLFAAGSDPGRPELAGVLVEYKDGSLRLVVSDSYRMAVRDIVPEAVTQDGHFRILIAASDVVSLRDRLAGEGLCELSEGSSGGLEVHLPGAEVLVLPGLPAEFPDYESTLQGLPAGRYCLVGRLALLEAFSQANGSLATLRLVPGAAQVDIQGDIATLTSDWAAPAFEVLLNAGFVAEALAAHVGPDVAIEVVEPLRPVTFRSADAGTFSVLVMPVCPRGDDADMSP